MESAGIILKELEKYNPLMLDEPRWLVLNKTDLLPDEEANAVCDDIIKRMNWSGPSYRVSAVNKQGTKKLIFDIMSYIEDEKDKIKTAEANIESDDS